MGRKTLATGDDSLPIVRKVRNGRKSKISKSVICPTCGTGCSSIGALRKHNSNHHVGSDAKRKVQAKKHREGAKAWNKKNQLGSYCNVDEKDKLEVFTGDVEQDDPIDDDENEFMRLAIIGRGKTRPYFGNVILVVPARVKYDDLDEYCNDKLSKYNVYIGTCAKRGGCIIHQMLDGLGDCSSPAKMLQEKNNDGKKKWRAYHYELTFDSGMSSEKNQKDAFKWESFHTYAAAGQRKTKSAPIRAKYLNQAIEGLEGVKGELTEDQIRRAYRLGRSNYCIIGPKEDFEGIQIRFPVRNKKGKQLFTKFTSELADKSENQQLKK